MPSGRGVQFRNDVGQVLRQQVGEARRAAQKESAATLGFTSAIAAYGAFFIPKSFGTSVALTGGAQTALYCFVVFYLICIAVTWWYYARKNAEVPC